MSKIEKIKKESAALKREFNKKLVGYIVAAFGLVAGLAWNEAVKGLIEHVYPMDGNSIRAKFIYAILATLVLVIVTVYLTKIFIGEEEENLENKKE